MYNMIINRFREVVKIRIGKRNTQVEFDDSKASRVDNDRMSSLIEVRKTNL